MMLDGMGVRLERLEGSGEEVAFSVSVDGHALGNVTFATYYEPAFKSLDRYVALWAGPMLCVVDRQDATLRCLEREDETHQIHPFTEAWIVEGELRIDLFDPATLTVRASYSHDEVIMDSWLDGEVVCIRDFQDRIVRLNPRDNLHLAAGAS